jgi:hypothetical protein
MTAHSQTGSRCSASAFAAVFAVLLASAFFIAAPFAAARTSAAQESTERISVVGHLELSGIHVKQIFIRNQGDHNYLYLLRPNKHAFAIVDVSKPEHPTLVARAVLQEPVGGNVDLPAQGSVLAISVVPDSVPNSTADATVTLHTETIRLVDMSDPKNPKTLKTFEGVTSMASDDGRKLVYIVNKDGLWIVRHHQNRPVPLCSSDAAETAIPSCD